MIIDSHAHYNHKSFFNTFRYLTRNTEGYTTQEGDLPRLMDELRDAGIACSVEPAISLRSCAELLEFCRRYPGRLFPTIGVHPTRVIHESWRNRKKLPGYASAPGVVAIGETGLDYHHQRKDQHRLKQHFWFMYQLGLARRMKLPVILHVRDAHKDALRILRLHPARKQGGVIHCFNGTKEIAEQYLNLGYHLGIGGSILQSEERAGMIWEAVAAAPLDRILLETDAPFILPACKDVIPSKVLRRTRNTSLILPAVIERIAELKGISPEEAENATARNAVRLFRLPVELE